MTFAFTRTAPPETLWLIGVYKLPNTKKKWNGSCSDEVSLREGLMSIESIENIILL